MNHQIDFRQKIVDTWPESLDDSLARKDWGYSPKFNINELTKIMTNLVVKKSKMKPKKKLNKNKHLILYFFFNLISFLFLFFLLATSIA